MGRRASVTSEVESAKAVALGHDAYIFGFPMVLMEVARRQLTNVRAPTSAGRAPVNQFGHLRLRTSGGPTSAAAGPDADTLVSSAWLDLRSEPLLVRGPTVRGRYSSLVMLDAWTDVFAETDTPAAGTAEAVMALVGPDWNGTLPRGIRAITSPTNTAWIMGCICPHGRTEETDGFTLTPLSTWGRTHIPPVSVRVDRTVDQETPPILQVAAMDVPTYFGVLAELMRANAPKAEDAAMVARLTRLGLVPGQPFNSRTLAPVLLDELERGRLTALQSIEVAIWAAGEHKSGQAMRDKREDKPDYFKRAIAAIVMFTMATLAPLGRPQVYERLNVVNS
jgi:hypothetical protein